MMTYDEAKRTFWRLRAGDAHALDVLRQAGITVPTDLRMADPRLRAAAFAYLKSRMSADDYSALRQRMDPDDSRWGRRQRNGRTRRTIARR